MDKQERINLLEEAQHLITDAVAKIQEAVNDTDQAGQAEAYTIPHLLNWVSAGNPYDNNIDKIIEGINEWDGLGEGDMYCEVCDRVHPEGEMMDEDICEKCYEDRLVEDE